MINIHQINPCCIKTIAYNRFLSDLLRNYKPYAKLPNNEMRKKSPLFLDVRSMPKILSLPSSHVTPVYTVHVRFF